MKDWCFSYMYCLGGTHQWCFSPAILKVSVRMRAFRLRPCGLKTWTRNWHCKHCFSLSAFNVICEFNNTIVPFCHWTTEWRTAVPLFVLWMFMHSGLKACGDKNVHSVSDWSSANTVDMLMSVLQFSASFELFFLNMSVHPLSTSNYNTYSGIVKLYFLFRLSDECLLFLLSFCAHPFC